MSIESKILDGYVLNTEKLLAYGFKPEGDKLVFQKHLSEDDMDIILSYDGSIAGMIIDRSLGEEYTLFRVEDQSGYSAGIRRKFVDLIADVREKCSENFERKNEQTKRLEEYIITEYGSMPERLWADYPTFRIFRKVGKEKWFALIGSVARNKIDRVSETEEPVDFLNVKADPEKISELLSVKGFFAAYHMNKKHWLTIVLDGTVADETVHEMIAKSHDLVK